MQLRQLKLQAFSSFTEEAVLDFDGPGLILLSGRNGSGKSSLSEALAFPLGYSQYSASELQSWFTDKTLKVTETFDSDLGKIVLSKGKKTSLSINGIDFKGSIAQIEEKRDQIIGLDPELLSLLTYRAQKQSGLLLSLPDADKKEFLTKLLPILGKVEAEMDKSKATIITLEAKLEARNNAAQPYIVIASPPTESISRLESQISDSLENQKGYKEANERISQLLKDLTTKNQKSIGIVSDGYRERIQAAEDEADGLKNVPGHQYDLTQLDELEAQLDECRTRALALEAKDGLILNGVNQHKREIQQRINVLKTSSGRKGLLAEKLDTVNGALKELVENKCPTCLRTWDEALGKVDGLNNEAETLISHIANCNEDLLKVVQLENELEQIVFTPNPEIAEFKQVLETIQKEYNAENNKFSNSQAIHVVKYQKLHNDALLKVANIKNERLTALADLDKTFRPSIDELKRAIDENNSKLNDLVENVSQAKIELSRQKQLVDIYTNKIKELGVIQADIAKLNIELAIEAEFARCIGREGFLGSVFEEILDQIADEANQTLASVSNVSHCSIKFKTESETAKGTIKKKIVPIITVGDKEAAITISKGRPRCSAVSGGMMASIDLAVDLAFGHVISQRSGISPSWLILDECLDGLDAKSKESCLDILQKYAHTRLVIVIDHMSEFTSMFNKVIEVTQDGKGNSTIT